MLIVRPWTRRDRRAMQHWQAHPAPIATRWNIHQPVIGLRVSYAIESEGATVGRISMTMPGNGTGWLGIWLEPGACGQGIGTNAMRLFLAHVFTSSGLFEIRLSVAIENVRAVRCYERLNFRTFAQEWRADEDGQQVAYILMALDRYEWSMGNGSPVSAIARSVGAGAGH